MRILLGNILLALLWFQFSCQSKTDKVKAGGRTMVDDIGREVVLPDSAVKILPISPSITEMLYLLIDESRIVARTQNDSFPPQVLQKPLINNYPVDFETLVKIKPDLIIAKTGILSLEDAKRIESLG